MPDITVNLTTAPDAVTVTVTPETLEISVTVDTGERVTEALYGTYRAMSWLDVGAISIPTEMLYVSSDKNGFSGWFERDTSYQVSIEGADGITDADGVVYRRTNSV